MLPVITPVSLAVALLSAMACHCSHLPVPISKAPSVIASSAVTLAAAPSITTQPPAISVTHPNNTATIVTSTSQQPPVMLTQDETLTNLLEEGSKYPSVLAALLAADAKSEAAVEQQAADEERVAQPQPHQSIFVHAKRPAAKSSPNDSNQTEKEESTAQQAPPRYTGVVSKQGLSQRAVQKLLKDDAPPAAAALNFTCPPGKTGYNFVHQHIHIHHHCFGVGQANTMPEPTTAVQQQQQQQQQHQQVFLEKQDAAVDTPFASPAVAPHQQDILPPPPRVQQAAGPGPAGPASPISNDNKAEFLQSAALAGGSAGQ